MIIIFMCYLRFMWSFQGSCFEVGELIFICLWCGLRITSLGDQWAFHFVVITNNDYSTFFYGAVEVYSAFEVLFDFYKNWIYFRLRFE